jgi:hypothetical protein
MFLRKSLILAVLILVGAVCVSAADIAGKWSGQFDSQVGPQKYVFEFKVSGATLSGTANSEIGEAGQAAKVATPITEGKISGDDISFVENLNYQGQELKMVYKGKVKGDEIQLERVEGGGNEKFVVKRVK